MIFKHYCYWILSLALAIPLLAGSAPAAQNQGSGGSGQMGGRRQGPMSPDMRLKAMTKNLNLTADQQAKIKPILEDERKKMQDLRNDSSVDRLSMRAKMMQIHQDSSDQIRGLLDDKQKDKFNKQEQERRQRMQDRRGGGMGGPAGPPQN
jgi:protein CpxP